MNKGIALMLCEIDFHKTHSIDSKLKSTKETMFELKRLGFINFVFNDPENARMDMFTIPPVFEKIIVTKTGQDILDIFSKIIETHEKE